MNVQKFIAVYMDHSSAKIMQLVNNIVETEIVHSKFNRHVKEEALHKSENLMHNKEQRLQLSYYNAIKDKLKESRDILLFGTTIAKTELQNLLKADSHFKDIKVVTTQTNKMTENQQHAFIIKHLKTHLI